MYIYILLINKMECIKEKRINYCNSNDINEQEDLIDDEILSQNNVEQIIQTNIEHIIQNNIESSTEVNVEPLNPKGLNGETLTEVNVEPLNHKGLNSETLTSVNVDQPPSYEASIILKPILASAPQLDDNFYNEKIFVDDFLNNNNIIVLPFIKNITNEIYEKTNILLKKNYDNIKYINKPTYEQWMMVYKSCKVGDGPSGKVGDGHSGKVGDGPSGKVGDEPSGKNFEKYLKLNDNHDYSFCLVLINDNYTFIEFVNDDVKTRELCDIASKHICKNRNYKYLVHIPKKYQDVKMLSPIINNNPFDIQFIHHRPYEIWKLAIKTNINSIKFMRVNYESYEEFFQSAIEMDPNVITYLNKSHHKYEELCIMALNINPKSLEHIPHENQTLNILETAFKKDITTVEYTNKTYNTLKMAIDINPNAIKKISYYFLTGKTSQIDYHNLCKLAVKKNGLVLEYITYSKANDYSEVVKIALNQNPNAKEFINSFHSNNDCTII